MSKTEKKLIKEVIYHELKKKIIIGSLKQRQRIVELDIAKQFQCSQAPVREALQKLEEEGLVESIPYTGTFVTEIFYDEIKELFDYRRQIELNALRKSIYFMSQQEIHNLINIIEKMKDAGKEGNIYSIISFDMEFHRNIVEKAGKKISLNIWSRLDLHVRRFIATAHPRYFENLEEIAEKHYPLIEVLQEGSIEKAEKAFSEHININDILKKLNL